MLLQEGALVVQALVEENRLSAEHLGRVGIDPKHDEHLLVVLIYLRQVAEAAQHHGVRVLELVDLLLKPGQERQDRRNLLVIAKHVLPLVELPPLAPRDLLVQQVLALEVPRCQDSILVRGDPVDLV